MRGLLGVAAALAVVATLSGCATRTPMAFEDDGERLTATSKPVLLMTATIKNEYKAGYQPRLLVVNVEKPDAKEAADRLNFTLDGKAALAPTTEQAGTTYLLRLQVEPGRYEIRGLTSLVQSFPINGFFFAPLHSTVEVKGPGVYYIGHVNAVVRERQGEEFRAGPVMPLVDQALVGASGGTFHVEIRDEFAKDEELFRSKFPALAGIKIEKVILPPFDRAKAQAWWEKN